MMAIATSRPHLVVASHCIVYHTARIPIDVIISHMGSLSHLHGPTGWQFDSLKGRRQACWME